MFDLNSMAPDSRFEAAEHPNIAPGFCVWLKQGIVVYGGSVDACNGILGDMVLLSAPDFESLQEQVIELSLMRPEGVTLQ